MTCFHPIQAYKSTNLTKKGKRQIVFKKAEGVPFLELTLPCGQCVGCRLERSRQWAIRCVHEASMHKKNCFITLTFNNEHLPKDGSLDVKDFQLFMKRLRFKYGPNIRFYHCGEYGEKLGRPHYHACLFNFDFEDKILWKEINGQKLYISESLSELWPFGFSTIGEVTFESAAYVARYIMKKINGDLAENHYTYVDPNTAELIVGQKLKPEYTTMSRKPGIGKTWLDKYKDDIYHEDFVVLNNKKMRPPKYYDNMYEIENPEDFAKIKQERLRSASLVSDNCSHERLEIREQVQLKKLEKLVRVL